MRCLGINVLCKQSTEEVVFVAVETYFNNSPSSGGAFRVATGTS
jgi:hypothetical protein